MAFEMVLEDAKLMANICSIISSIVTESSIIVDKEGIKIKAFDASHISMIDFFMKKEAFEKYNLDDETNIGLSLETLNSILKTASASEKLTMLLNDETKRFVVEFTGQKQKRKFALSLIKIPEEGNIPDSIHFDFANKFEVKASFIQQVLKDAEMVSDYLRIKTSNEGILFGAESDTKEMETFIDPESDDILDNEGYSVDPEGSDAVYALDFLSNFLKGIRSSDSVRMSFNQAQPIRIEYEIEDKGHLIYFVAPRIEESEEIE